MTMNAPSAEETTRQYRVARQTLAMHSYLRDRHARVGFAIELLLLVFSAITSCTTFAGDGFFRSLHVSPDAGRLVLGIASTVAFAGSLVLLLMDPRGKAATHRDAASKWSEVVLQFRRLRGEDGAWPTDAASALADAYAQVCETTCPIPDAKFNHLKSRYIRKVEVSQLLERHPGCPIILLALFCRLRHTHAAIKAFRAGAKAETKQLPASAADQRASSDRSLPDGP